MREVEENCSVSKYIFCSVSKHIYIIEKRQENENKGVEGTVLKIEMLRNPRAGSVPLLQLVISLSPGSRTSISRCPNRQAKIISSINSTLQKLSSFHLVKYTASFTNHFTQAHLFCTRSS